ncbi:MAG: hypothetical protein ACR2OZ_03505 [Verrucomicrobiales bacterium]
MKALHFILAITLLVAGPTLAAERKVPSFEDIVEFVADLVKPGRRDHFKDFKITKAEFKAVLRYDVVTREQWIHDYSHVGGGDRTGTITVKDKTKIQWFVKPGGLAHLTFPDGTKICLVQHKTK